MSQKTSLYDCHVEQGGRMVEFAGWMMPVTFKGIKEEHAAVRNNIGLFDVSHMGEVWVRGEKSLETLQWLTSNDVSKLEEGEAQYSLLTNFDGGIVDDIIVYCLEKNQEYLVCVNAANIEKDVNWMHDYNKGAEITNESDKWSQVAIQGPKAMQLLTEVFDSTLPEMKPFTFKKFTYEGEEVLLAKTGYTGEDGAEVFLPHAVAPTLWKELLEKGEGFGVQPIGLGARDTLRTEMKYSLYGNDINDTTSPIEAGLGWTVKLNKGDFIGRDMISRVKADGPKRKLVGFKVTDRGIARHGYPVLNLEGVLMGEVTSGTYSPTLGEAVGIAYVAVDYASLGTEFFVEIRGRKVKSQVVKTPFI